MSADVPRLITTHALTPDQITAVDELVRDATDADGVPPLREQVLLQVRAGGAGLSLLAEGADPAGGHLLGFAQLDQDDAAAGPALEVAVHPKARNQGIGTALLDAILTHCPPPPSPVRLWAHGQNAAAAQLAHARGFLRERHLHQMRRPLTDELPCAELPPGVVLRTFDPDSDVPGLQRLNAAAFTQLPDQGSWTEEDIRTRMAEDWFDPAGLVLAITDSELVGFHWTKTAPPLRERPAYESWAAEDLLGEVYVLGVHPQERGRGLGRALTLAGLHHLRDLGLMGARLYVDATNIPAVALYTSLGFSVWDSDTLFRR